MNSASSSLDSVAKHDINLNKMKAIPEGKGGMMTINAKDGVPMELLMDAAIGKQSHVEQMVWANVDVVPNNKTGMSDVNGNHTQKDVLALVNPLIPDVQAKINADVTSKEKIDCVKVTNVPKIEPMLDSINSSSVLKVNANVLNTGKNTIIGVIDDEKKKKQKENVMSRGKVSGSGVTENGDLTSTLGGMSHGESCFLTDGIHCHTSNVNMMVANPTYTDLVSNVSGAETSADLNGNFTQHILISHKHPKANLEIIINENGIKIHIFDVEVNGINLTVTGFNVKMEIHMIIAILGDIMITMEMVVDYVAVTGDGVMANVVGDKGTVSGNGVAIGEVEAIVVEGIIIIIIDVKGGESSVVTGDSVKVNGDQLAVPGVNVQASNFIGIVALIGSIVTGSGVKADGGNDLTVPGISVMANIALNVTVSGNGVMTNKMVIGSTVTGKVVAIGGVDKFTMSINGMIGISVVVGGADLTVTGNGVASEGNEVSVSGKGVKAMNGVIGGDLVVVTAKIGLVVTGDGVVAMNLVILTVTGNGVSTIEGENIIATGSGVKVMQMKQVPAVGHQVLLDSSVESLAVTGDNVSMYLV